MAHGSTRSGCVCGHPLHRSPTRTLREKLLRHVLFLKKFRCGTCGRVRWAWSRSSWTTLRRARRDPIARRVFVRRWRRSIAIAVFALVCAAALGQAVARWHEAMQIVEPVP